MSHAQPQPQCTDLLRDYLILGPEPEAAFDELARLAGRLCDAPCGLICLINKEGYWFKSRVGLAAEDASGVLALCARVAGHPDPIIIQDAKFDDRCTRWLGGLGGLPMPHVRFFAGMALAMPQGPTLGALAVAGPDPRPLTEEQGEALAAVARQVLNQLELRRILAELATTIGERHRVETALQQSEERYRELLENANDIIYTHDLEGNFLSLNAAGERITGYAREEVLRMNIRDVLTPEYLELARRMIAVKVAGEPPRIYKVEIFGKDGSRIALELSTRLVREAGRPTAIQGIARDVTERRKTEQALQSVNEKLTVWVRELERRNRETTQLHEMGELLQTCLTAEEAYAVVSRCARELFPHLNGALFMQAGSRDLFEAVATWGDPLTGERVFAADECWALRRGRLHSHAAGDSGLHCRHRGHVTPSTAGSLCVPMMAQGEALGVLHLQGILPEPEPTLPQFRAADTLRELAVTVAEHIALSLASLKLRETLRNQSIRDPLTGLFNRRYLEATLAREMLRAVRKERPLGIILLDVDHFKQYNDTRGHPAGDALLRELGAFLQRNTRGDDLACRYGGEEFLLIFPETNLETARIRAEQLRAGIKQVVPMLDGRKLDPVSLSLGVAAFPEHGNETAALLAAADRALYQAKAAGRDRVVVAS